MKDLQDCVLKKKKYKYSKISKEEVLEKKSILFYEYYKKCLVICDPYLQYITNFSSIIFTLQKYG